MAKSEVEIVSKQVGPLHYLERASDSGASKPTIVLLHGNSFSSAVFEKQLRSPRLCGFRLIAFDLPGHGRSKPLPEDVEYSIASFATLVTEALETLKIKQAVLAGWSHGGHVALDMVKDTKCIKGAMIFGAPPLRAGTLSTIHAYHFSRDMFLASKPVFSVTDAMRFEKFCLGTSADGRFYETLMNTAPKVRSDVFKSALQGRNGDQYELALASQKPLCFLQGENDPLVRASYIEDLGADPDFRGEIAMIEHAGHAPFLDQQEIFDFMLASFANRALATKPLAAPLYEKAA